ncbi:hypothetical protein [Actinomadura xylanilytica]|uniref:hypothetical protein n=1 Tax=Actinomadura xylanilytica TaxID=887459 RepID=UPI00255AF10A|nr:hypothetical protein [Actinomadura xylanilytica]MDL4772755.1 hypothetical protein [Actinomadura xylanilytica]
MRPDGDPEPDDYGLPRVDVVVPDDARELDRDILAYHRERRQRRRRARIRRLVRPATRYGLAIPIITGALLIALVSGAMLTAFGPRPTPRPTVSLLAPHPVASPGQVNGTLPAGEVFLTTGTSRKTPLTDLRPAVFAIVPPTYKCDDLVAELAARTQDAKLNFWLVADPRAASGHAGLKVKRLTACAGTAHAGAPQIIEDPSALLAGAYAPAPGSAGPSGSAGAELTAVFVRPDGVVTDVVRAPRAGPELTAKVKSLETG